MTTLRYPDGSPDCAHNHFGWRFEGPGLQPVAYEPHNDEPLLPVESFRDPRLQNRPPFLNDQIRQDALPVLHRQAVRRSSTRASDGPR